MDMLVFSLSRLFLSAKSPFSIIPYSHCFLCCFLLIFPSESLYFMVKKTMIFIYISADCIQHEFFIYFCAAVIEPPKTVVLLNIPKVPFGLDGTDLTFQNSLLALDVGIGFSFNASHCSLIFITLFRSPSYPEVRQDGS